MLIRSWLYVFAFAGLILASPAFSQENVEGNKPETDTNQGEQAIQKPPSFVIALEGIESAIRDLIKKKGEEEREREAEQSAADLAAQEEMARWAMDMAIAAIIGAILTAFGLAAILRTLHHTKRAADYTKDMLEEARKTTKSAEASIEITRSIGMAEVKCYINLSEISLLVQQNYINFTLEISNLGNSPALNVDLTAKMHVAQYNTDPRFNVERYKVIGNISRTGQSFADIISDQEVPVDKFLNSPACSGEILISGWDVFGEEFIIYCRFGSETPVKNGYVFPNGGVFHENIKADDFRIRELLRLRDENRNNQAYYRAKHEERLKIQKN